MDLRRQGLGLGIANAEVCGFMIHDFAAQTLALRAKGSHYRQQPYRPKLKPGVGQHDERLFELCSMQSPLSYTVSSLDTVLNDCKALQS